MNDLTVPTRQPRCMRRARRHAHPRAGQAGVGLIEVLVAVLVLSVGFLGVAALQARSLSINNSAMARSMATVASYSILDAMRADLASAQNGAYNTATPVRASACPAAGATLVTLQLNQWCKQLGSALGATSSTTGTITCIGTSGDCTVVVVYDDSKSGTAGTGSATGLQTVTTWAML